jgi:hypothetical protein
MPKCEFMKSPFFYISQEPDNEGFYWQLKPEAPEEVREEYEKWRKSIDEIAKIGFSQI